MNTLRLFNVSERAVRARRNDGVLIDSGASVSLFRDKSAFYFWDPDFNQKSFNLTLADGTRRSDTILGRGHVAVQITDINGKPHVMKLQNVLYMPSLNYEGIISVMASIPLGYGFNFKENNFSMEFKENIVFPFKPKWDLCFLNAVELDQPSNRPAKRRSFGAWHAIMGHLHQHAMLKLPDHVEGMEMVGKGSPKCEVCILNKAKKHANKRPDQKATEPFEFIHTDIHQPEHASHESIGGFKYVVGFVDDFSGYMCIYPIRTKDEVTTKFKEFIAFANSIGKIKRLRSDMAAEYLSVPFKQICQENNIRHETSVAYQSHQNGTAERVWGTLKPKARCLLNPMALSHKFWPYAYLYAAYLYNRSYVQRLDSTPYFKIHQSKPNISKLERFGIQMYSTKNNPECNLGLIKDSLWVSHSCQGEYSCTSQRKVGL